MDLMLNNKKHIYRGILLAVLATIIWSGNFVVARGVIHEIPPISLAFYRWLTGTIIIAPFAIRHFKREQTVVYSNWKYIFWVAIVFGPERSEEAGLAWTHFRAPDGNVYGVIEDLRAASEGRNL